MEKVILFQGDSITDTGRSRDHERNKGAGYANILKTTIFVKDLADFATVNQVYAGYFEGDYPARSCVQVAALPMGGLVEIEAIAKI